MSYLWTYFENMPNQGEKPVFLQLIWIAEARNVHEELDSSVQRSGTEDDYSL